MFGCECVCLCVFADGCVPVTHSCISHHVICVTVGVTCIFVNAFECLFMQGCDV